MLDQHPRGEPCFRRQITSGLIFGEKFLRMRPVAGCGAAVRQRFDPPPPSGSMQRLYSRVRVSSTPVTGPFARLTNLLFSANSGHSLTRDRLSQVRYHPPSGGGLKPCRVFGLSEGPTRAGHLLEG